MPAVSFDNLLIILVIAAAVPLLLGYAPRLRIPSVVIEIVAGVVLGPSVLGWVHVDLPVRILSVVGLAFLLFLAGLEIDVHQLRGRLLQAALAGYLVTLVLGVGVSSGFHALGWISSPLFIAITLSATSLGLVVAVLKDAGQLGSPTGQTAIAASSVADFGAIVLLTLLFSASGGGPGEKIFLLAAFGALVVVAAVVVGRAGRSMRLGDVLVRIQDTTAEIRVRCAVLLLVALVALAEHLGFETILGAFLAGAVVGLVDRDASTHPHFRTKLEAIGYGFLIPVFFISSGVQLDLRGLLHSPSAQLRVPVFLVALLVVRGLPALLYVRRIGRRGSLAAALLQATSLPLIVTASQIGVATGRLSAVTAAALICAGLLSVLIFPLLALTVLRPMRSRPAQRPLARVAD
jgi:Kef-type K+ transport system membrane component KefB